jgi:hypothetical protein
MEHLILTEGAATSLLLCGIFAGSLLVYGTAEGLVKLTVKAIEAQAKRKRARQREYSRISVYHKI